MSRWPLPWLLLPALLVCAAGCDSGASPAATAEPQVGSESAGESQVEPAAEPDQSPLIEPTGDEAAVVDGFIFRDAETRRLISETAAVALPDPAEPPLRLEVRKSRYRLSVWQGEQRLKVYPVALGGAPAGAKQRQGDQSTPQGTYRLRPHHPSPSFGSCFYVCYPNEDDVERGLQQGLIGRSTARRILGALDRGRLPPHDTTLGGLILIHGTKDRTSRSLTSYNWTLGCIAMENRDVVELLSVFRSSDRPTVAILP